MVHSGRASDAAQVGAGQQVFHLAPFIRSQDQVCVIDSMYGSPLDLDDKSDLILVGHDYVRVFEPTARRGLRRSGDADLGCGGGDQARLFAEKGYSVVGIDIAPSLIEFAGKQFRNSSLKGEFLVGDMREIDYNAEFDACVILSGTFGFFGDEEDQRVLTSICRALKAGGRVFIMFSSANRSGERSRTWSANEYGWELTERWIDTETSTSWGRTFIVQKDGTRILPKDEPGYHATERIRCYTIPEMKAMFSKAGLGFSGSYSDRSLAASPDPIEPETVRNIVVGYRQR